MELTMLSFRTTARAVIATACLTVGSLGAGAVAAQAAPHAGHGNPLAACQKWAKEHTFVMITRASGNPKAGLTVTGQRLGVHCGGPDDFHYVQLHKPFTGHLLPSAKVEVLVYGKNGPEDSRLPASKFAHWVATDHNGNTYQLTGSFKAIRGLLEAYIP
jgi:hypothetical protein